ncbi:putative peptidase [Triangularia setosa]|uniref:Peptidase n=1 Tax=Triangularia setosa TaxID=2587417 RepID=A0AAN6W099_9PEZI|nr:putative peptidase [Podospora setosa]
MGSVGTGTTRSNVSGDEEETINVLITGFAPFRTNFPVNPSWEIAKSLPEYLPPPPPAPFPGIAGHVLPPGGSTTGIYPGPPPNPGSQPATPVKIPRVRLLVHPSPIHVGYRAVRDLVPSLWHLNDDSLPSAKTPQIDLAIHIGMAGPRGYYSIERRGHKSGYDMGDVDGKPLAELDDEMARNNVPHPWEGLPEELLSDLEMEDVLERWRRHSPPYSDLRISEDAGHYLCDFIYYSSLAHLTRNGKGRRVVFLHVPSEASAAWVKVGRELCLGLVRAMVESEVVRVKAGREV